MGNYIETCVVKVNYNFPISQSSNRNTAAMAGTTRGGYEISSIGASSVGRVV
jgi:hypothetical protein